jgi:hypothetical protein
MTNLGSSSEILGAIVGLVFTLLIFSYLLGDNALFRFAIHVFIGVAAGYVMVLAFNNIIWPRLFLPLLTADLWTRLLTLVPLVLSLMLLAKIYPRFSGIGSPVMALLVGVGAAVAIGGATLGTLFPQMMTTVNQFDAQAVPVDQTVGGMLLNGSVILIGTVTSLAYFRFHVRTPQPVWSQAISWIGQAFIALTLGVVFAGVYAAALTALIERLSAFTDLVRQLLGM